MESLCKRGPYEGLRVLDFGQYLAGPLAAMLFADQGADVVHLERPGTSGSNDKLDAVLQRNKSRMTVDLKSESGLRQALELVEIADVLIENFRPGVMDRLGLGYEACQRRNSGLIYLSLPGFASSDAENANQAAWEGVIGAATGLFTNLSISRNSLGLPPVFTALPLPSVYGAAHGATAVAMALVAREMTGSGERIEVPLSSAMLSAMGSNVMSYGELPERYELRPVPRVFKEEVLSDLKRSFSSKGKEGEREALAFSANLLPPMMRSFQCSDGRWLYVFALDHRRMSRRLLEELGLWERFRDILVERDPYLPTSVANNISDVGTLGKDINEQLCVAMTEVFKQDRAEVWEHRLCGAGISCAMQRSTAEWLETAHVAESGISVGVSDPILGSMTQPGPAIWLDDSPLSLLSPRPRATTSAEAIAWAKRGERSGRRGSQHADNGCLAGVRVLDLSTMIAGPACGRTLAQYGAEVIKIDAVSPYLGPRMVLFYAAELNPGKRSILLDLKKPGGRDAFLRLVDGVDVVMHNVRSDPAKELGLDIETLRKRNPNIIVCELSAYDGPQRGPFSSRAGYDPTVQAATGIATRYGGKESPELHGVASTIDYLTGFLAAFGTATALYKRSLFPGRGTTVRASLALSAMIAQLPFSYSYNGREWNEAARQDAIGSSPYSRLYKALDGWVFVDITSDALKAIDLLPRYSGLIAADDPAALLSSRCLEASVAEIVDQFRTAGAGAHEVIELGRIRTAHEIPRTESAALPPDAGSLAVMKDTNHASGVTVHTVAPWHARLVRQPLRAGKSSEKHGESSVSILQEIGLSGSEVTALIKDRATATYLSFPYLPT
jgi:crotonobetainyl-CoA:carnitine CoA-transferase CaiB-like acyl-CoA transferase